MCNGPVLQKVIAFSLPLMLSSCLQLLFNAADVIVVGRCAHGACGQRASVFSAPPAAGIFYRNDYGVYGFCVGEYAGRKYERLLRSAVSVQLYRIFHRSQCKCGTTPWKPGRSGNERRHPHSRQCQYFIWICHDSIRIFIWSANAPMDGDSCRCH